MAPMQWCKFLLQDTPRRLTGVKRLVWPRLIPHGRWNRWEWAWEHLPPPLLLFSKIKLNRGIQNGGFFKNILLFNTCRFSASNTTLSFFTFDSDINAPLTLSALSALSHCIVWMIASRKFMHNGMKFWLKNIGRMQKYFYPSLKNEGCVL